MRTTARERGIIEQGDDNFPKTKQQSKQGKKWYNMIPYEDPEFMDDIPKLRNLRGSKVRITLRTFDEIGKVCQQIFEGNKSFFRFRSQVDLLSHYLGTKILEQIYVVRKCHKKSKLSQLLEDHEEQFVVWDQMKTVKDLFSTFCEKKVNGFVTDEELDNLASKYISTFENEDQRIKMAKVLDLMVEESEEHKASERIRQKKRYEIYQKQKEYGIHEVT